MRHLKISVLVIFLALLALSLSRGAGSVIGQSTGGTSAGTGPTSVDSDPPAGTPLGGADMASTDFGATAGAAVTEAGTGFDDEPNGPDDPKFVTFAVHHNVDLPQFETVDKVADGLGPVYNAQSCRECHQSPVSGAISQVTELRAGHRDASGNFVPATVTIGDGTVTIANRSLINDRAICPGELHNNNGAVTFSFPDTDAQEHVPNSETVTTLRASLNLLGDGFVEATNSNTFAQISNNQPAGMQGQLVFVPLLEAGGQLRLGRFGWKDQQASLLSFSGDAYVNEMGITNRLFTHEFTTLCDTVDDPEDTPSSTVDPITGTHLADIDRFTRFMRATNAPSRGPGAENGPNPNPDIVAGSQLFDQISCSVCHVRSIVTSPLNTSINGGTFHVPAQLASKRFHPFGDFLLHNIGTGDGIVQTTLPGSDTLDQSTAQKVRTAPLWGLRTHDRFLHDQRALTLTQAILAHAGEAQNSANSFRALTSAQKQQLLKFLNSL
jgi:CxxC motif-containing protein (DUF1111 family)